MDNNNNFYGSCFGKMTTEEKHKFREKVKEDLKKSIELEEINEEKNVYEELLKQMNKKDQELIEQSKDSLKPVVINVKKENLDSFLKNIENI